jgi:hypothetical protein
MKPGTTSRGDYKWQEGQGLLPEEDDCHEAVKACLEIRDAQEPPSGSGRSDATIGSTARFFSRYTLVFNRFRIYSGTSFVGISIVYDFASFALILNMV